MGTPTTDLCDQHPEAAVLPAGFNDYGGVTTFDGTALTVKCFEDNSRIKELSQTPGLGRVLVVDGGGSLRCALLGDVIAIDLAKNGWSGIIVHGCVRDRQALAGIQLGVKALGAHPRKSFKRNEGTVGVPIEIAGATVREGDQVHADLDGVVILPAQPAHA